VDIAIQRLIEFIISIPQLPLWILLAALVPSTWGIVQVYFAITTIISLLGWTGMARVVRGRFLSLREEEFVTAARLAGAREGRIIFRHMLPLFVSHIIASVTLTVPAIIIAETSLSFLGIGLREPAISLGVMLVAAQRVRTIALNSWLLLPGLVVIVIILSFNFIGDGLRDAADPYGRRG
jgi:peptide/nickel transport system permease protein